MSEQMIAASAVRLADAMLRCMGGREVALRMPEPAVPADVAEQLGLATPSFRDMPLAPTAFRKARATISAGKRTQWELMVSATAVEGLVGTLSAGGANVLFANAAGILIDGVLYEIESASEEQAYGKPYVYRLILYTPQDQWI